MLDGDATYYVRLRFYDSYGNPSEWSDRLHFTTMDDVGDLDNNGVPDEQDVSYDTDLNGDGIADMEQPETIKAAHYNFADVTIGVEKASDSVTGIEGIETIEPSTVFDIRLVEHMVEHSIVNPRSFVYGLFSYRIRVDRPGATAVVTIRFSCKISRAKKFFKFDTVNGWQDYSEHTIFGKDGHSITLDLQDGGYGDSDGVANGTVLDPGGLFEEESGSAEISFANSASSPSTGGGCFIGATGDNSKHSQGPTQLHPALVATVTPLIAIRDVLVAVFGATETSIGLCLTGLFLACLLKTDGHTGVSKTTPVKRGFL
jgi:chitinase